MGLVVVVGSGEWWWIVAVVVEVGVGIAVGDKVIWDFFDHF